MIKFFRKLRRAMIEENRLVKYLLYALGEIILVVNVVMVAAGTCVRIVTTVFIGCTLLLLFKSCSRDESAPPAVTLEAFRVESDASGRVLLC